ncbi:unnamed protein product [Brassicogethes aeneus]|uniref:Cyclic GMP-AMP synthase n=1 Tax=Brassicogethes aeneus TaxID=1431903 RepID=A0A9P0ARD2_BRAAE|nr:unnamed protein product [Brassicogethes aeneus]
MDEKKYRIMENILNKINQKCIQLETSETKVYQTIMTSVTNELVNELKKDATFKILYERMFFGGSYYDNLKVGKAEEYDLDLVLNLPVVISPKVEHSNKHGFVYCRIQEFEKLLKRAEKDPLLIIHSFLDKQNYLSTVKIFSWMQSILNKALNEMSRDGTKTIFTVTIGEERITVFGSLKTKAPAFTFNITGNYKGQAIDVDIDLVPCFQFQAKHHWPASPYKPNPSEIRKTFLIVPKKPYDVKDGSIERYWRLSFQEQEREMINKDYKALKSTVKLLKKLRDQQKHVKIASYFIKTIFLLEVEKHQECSYWSRPLSIVFMTMLRTYQKALEDGNIPYFWNRKFNLIGHLKPATLSDMANFLKRIINDIDKNISEDPFVVAKYLMNPVEVIQLKMEFNLKM